jgi:hypothetical protein
MLGLTICTAMLYLPLVPQGDIHLNEDLDVFEINKLTGGSLLSCYTISVMLTPLTQSHSSHHASYHAERDCVVCLAHPWPLVIRHLPCSWVIAPATLAALVVTSQVSHAGGGWCLTAPGASGGSHTHTATPKIHHTTARHTLSHTQL